MRLDAVSLRSTSPEDKPKASADEPKKANWLEGKFNRWVTWTKENTFDMVGKLEVKKDDACWKKSLKIGLGWIALAGLLFIALAVAAFKWVKNTCCAGKVDDKTAKTDAKETEETEDVEDVKDTEETEEAEETAGAKDSEKAKETKKPTTKKIEKSTSSEKKPKVQPKEPKPTPEEEDFDVEMDTGAGTGTEDNEPHDV